MRICKYIHLSIFLMLLSGIGWTSAALADAEVTLANGTWSARVNGSSVYEGNRFFDAVNAAINGMGSGTINIRNSGDSGPDGGDVYAIRPKADQTLDFHVIRSMPTAAILSFRCIATGAITSPSKTSTLSAIRATASGFADALMCCCKTSP